MQSIAKYDRFVERETEGAKISTSSKLKKKSLDSEDASLVDLAKQNLAVEERKNQIREAIIIGPPLDVLEPDASKRETLNEKLRAEEYIAAAQIRDLKTTYSTNLGHFVNRILHDPKLHRTSSQASDAEQLSLLQRELPLREFITKLGLAVFGGLALLVPMLIMTLHPTLTTRLMTTSMFVTQPMLGADYFRIRFVSDVSVPVVCFGGHF